MISAMGSFLSRFRAKPTTKELLEQIDSDIQSIEDYKWTKMRQQKNLMALIFFGSGLIYAFAAILFYFYFLPRSSGFYDKCFYCLPLVVLPAIAYLLQRSLQWYFQWIIEGNEDRLKTLRKEKRKILDRIMETETYKVAKELLEKFDPSSLKSDKTDSPKSPNPNLRFRGTPATSPVTSPRPVPGSGPQMLNQLARPGSANISQQAIMAQPIAQSPRRFVRPILPGERSVLEKMVDYVVGDGPNNRYALICCFCHMHNGMALKYEFEYLAFRCCYCNTYNPPRKVRSNAPRIMPPSPRPSVEEPESEPDSDIAPKSAVDIVDVSAPDAATQEDNRGGEEETESIQADSTIQEQELTQTTQENVQGTTSLEE